MLIPRIVRDPVRRFRRNRDGSAAVEFALVAPVFFALIFAIIETGMIFFAGQVLETTVQDSGRLFYTSQTVTESGFKAAFCSRVNVLMDCSKLCLDVRTYLEGAAISPPNPMDSSGVFTNCTFNGPPANTPNTTVVVRAFYQWPLFVTQLGYNVADIGRGTTNARRLLSGINAVRPQ